MDDSKTVRLLVQRALRGRNCEVLPAEDGPAGLALAAQVHPALILLDVTMPGMDGFATLRHLQGDHRLASIPVIMLPPNGAPATEEAIRTAGAAGFLPKPLCGERVAAEVERIVGAGFFAPLPPPWVLPGAGAGESVQAGAL